MRKKSSGFFILSKFWLTAGVIALALLTMGAAIQSNAAEALIAETPRDPAVDVTKVVRTKPIGHKRVRLKGSKPKVKRAAKRPELVGKTGYAVAGGNCVAEPGINNPGFGNPSDWPVTSQTPRIGMTAVFTWNHVGVITGIWRNGDLEVRHQNYWGGQHRFPRSTFRGFR